MGVLARTASEKLSARTPFRKCGKAWRLNPGIGFCALPIVDRFLDHFVFSFFHLFF
jgi:hypothetical protein